LINSYLKECSERVFEYAIELETLTDAILLARRGLIHPKILTPKELFNNLKKTHYVINNKQFPVPLEPHQFTNLIDVNNINIFYKNRLMFLCLLKYDTFNRTKQFYIISCNSITTQAKREEHLCIHKLYLYLFRS